MSIETLVVAALAGLAGGRIYADEAPQDAAVPYIVHQQVGGVALNYIEPAVPDKQNARVQIAVWSARRTEATALSEQVEHAMRLAAALQTEVLGARRSVNDPMTGLRGNLQDFSIWAPNT